MKFALHVLLVAALVTPALQPAFAQSATDQAIAQQINAKSEEIEKSIGEIQKLQDEISSARTVRNVTLTVTIPLSLFGLLFSVSHFNSAALSTTGDVSGYYTRRLIATGSATVAAMGTAAVVTTLKNSEINALQRDLSEAKARQEAALAALSALSGRR